MTVDISGFVKHGCFSEIPYGISRNDFLILMGDCECTVKSAKKNVYPSIYKYGIVEFYYGDKKNGTLYGILVQPNSYPCEEGNVIFSYTGIDMESPLTYAQTIEYLNKNKVHFNENQDGHILTTDSGVDFFFHEESTPLFDEYELIKFGSFIDANDI